MSNNGEATAITQCEGLGKSFFGFQCVVPVFLWRSNALRRAATERVDIHLRSGCRRTRVVCQRISLATRTNFCGWPSHWIRTSSQKIGGTFRALNTEGTNRWSLPIEPKNLEVPMVLNQWAFMALCHKLQERFFEKSCLKAPQFNQRILSSDLAGRGTNEKAPSLHLRIFRYFEKFFVEKILDLIAFVSHFALFHLID